ncbi:hypothetical protein [Pseudomonas sp. FEN]|nr:hypothetical protein [Pseudomonas sp. FEN]
MQHNDLVHLWNARSMPKEQRRVNFSALKNWRVTGASADV